MQIMPRTWIELSVRYDLGIDPFDARDNIAAGTAYLREMLDRFGLEGFLAAYNAGPERYEDHLADGRPLPDETKTYVAKLATLIRIEQRGGGAPVIRHSISWQRAPVFVMRSDGSSADRSSTSAAHSLSAQKGIPNVGGLALAPRPTGLFVQPPDEVQSR